MNDSIVAKKFENLLFDDCMVVSFSRDVKQRSLTLTFEAYNGHGSDDEPGLYVLECYDVRDVQLNFSPEFSDDLNRPYDPTGDDQRANEIYELRRDESGYIHLLTDMVEGRFYAHQCRLLRVVEIEANEYA